MTEDYERFLSWRGIDPGSECDKCHGRGSRVYPSTAVFWGGIGGASMTRGLCDVCWGSGDKHRTWTDLKKWRAEQQFQIAKQAVTLLASSAGADYQSCSPAAEEICRELDKLSRGRKQRPNYFHDVCELLAKTIRRGFPGEEK